MTEYGKSYSIDQKIYMILETAAEAIAAETGDEFEFVHAKPETQEILLRLQRILMAEYKLTEVDVGVDEGRPSMLMDPLSGL